MTDIEEEIRKKVISHWLSVDKLSIKKLTSLVGDCREEFIAAIDSNGGIDAKSMQTILDKHGIMVIIQTPVRHADGWSLANIRIMKDGEEVFNTAADYRGGMEER